MADSTYHEVLLALGSLPSPCVFFLPYIPPALLVLLLLLLLVIPTKLLLLLLIIPTVGPGVVDGPGIFMPIPHAPVLLSRVHCLPEVSGRHRRCSGPVVLVD